MAFFKTLMTHIGQFQSRLILSVVYFTLILLFAPVAWFFDKSLNLDGFRSKRDSAWTPRKPETDEFARGKLQF
jgi:hypothetical protein